LILVEGENKQLEKLKELQQKFRVIEFTDDSIYSFTRHQNNYSIALLMSTTNNQIPGADIAKIATEEFRTVSEAYFSSLGRGGYNSEEFIKQPIFFARCELEKCRETFKEGGTKAGWKVIPKIFIILPNPEKSAVDVMKWIDMNSEPIFDKAPQIAKWIREVTKYPIYVEIPFLERYGNVIGTLILGSLFLFVLFHRVKEWIQIPLFWFTLSMGTYVFSMAGIVFNSIHSPPWNYYNPQSKQTMYIYPSSRHQFVAEGMILAALLSGVSLSIVGFGYLIPKLKENRQKRVAFVILAFVFFTLYSQLLKVFRMKYGWYPY